MTSDEFISKFKSSYLWGNILAMFAVVICLAIGVKFGLDFYTHHGEGIVVPNVKGDTYDQAVQILEERGLKVEVNDSGYNRRLPADCILEQTPSRGCIVKSGHTIYVTVNSPHSPMLTVPDLIDNSSLREAQAKLTSMGFSLLEPEYVRGEKDWVYGIKSRGHNVYTGDRVSADIPLILQIGDGKFDGGNYDVDVTDGQGGDDFEEVSGPDNGSDATNQDGQSTKENNKE